MTPDPATAVLPARPQPATSEHPADAQKREPWIDILPRPICASVARQFANSKLTHYAGADETLLKAFISDVKVVVSELVTNSYAALCRAALPLTPSESQTIRLGLHCTARWAHIYVADCLEEPPRRQKPAVDDEHGRGLALVEAYAKVLWTQPYEGGKTVHALMAAPGVILTADDTEGLASAL